MFDKHEPFHRIEKQAFRFVPNRFEIWIGGKMVNIGDTSSPLDAKVITENGDDKIQISFQDKNLITELAPTNVFDDFISAHDRLQLITIPNNTNSSCIGLQAMQMNIGATRQTKNFNRNEPYCCNLFTIQGQIAKITFSYSNPEKLVEFYADNNSETDEGKEIVNKAYELLSNSKNSLIAKHSKITTSDIEADVINVACKFILENFGDDIVSNHNINEIHPYIQQNMKFQPLAQIFTELAKEIYSGNYTNREANAGQLAIIQNISWGGMWDFLRDYFAKKHNIQIDNSQSDTTVFYSVRHERFENNQLTSKSEVERIVRINSQNEKEIIVSIEPSLSAKKAKLIDKSNNKYKYKGFDEDYMFVVTKDKFDEITEFELHMPNRKLRIVYYG